MHRYLKVRGQNKTLHFEIRLKITKKGQKILKFELFFENKSVKKAIF